MRHRLTWDKAAARNPGGLYGVTKRTQSDCETAIRKLGRHASLLAKSAYTKDERIATFLQVHAKRAKSTSARMLVNAMREMGPTIGSGGKTAASRTLGLYGQPSNTVKLGLAICAQLREQAGLIAADLHGRRMELHAPITGFFSQHAKAAKCYGSRMLMAGYPDPRDMSKAASANKMASPVDTWLAWDMSELDEDDNEHYG